MSVALQTAAALRDRPARDAVEIALHPRVSGLTADSARRQPCDVARLAHVLPRAEPVAQALRAYLGGSAQRLDSHRTLLGQRQGSGCGIDLDPMPRGSVADVSHDDVVNPAHRTSQRRTTPGEPR